MPYISELNRNRIWTEAEEGSLPTLSSPGELNYFMCEILISYIHNKGLSYQSINDCLGALEGVKQEFYRKVAVPYEEKKIVENGDLVWPK